MAYLKKPSQPVATGAKGKTPVKASSPPAKKTVAKKSVAKSTKAPTTSTPAPSQDWKTLAAQEGYPAWMINQPDLAPIMQQVVSAAQAGTPWSDSRIQAAVQATSWYRNSSDPARAFYELQQDDPNEATRQQNQKAADITNIASGLGFNMDSAAISNLALEALQQGWDATQLQQNIGLQFKYNPSGTYTGTIGTALTNFKKMAGDYLVPVSDETLNGWAQKVAEGNMAADGSDIQDYLINASKNAWGNDPNLTSALDRGLTTKDYFDPYVQQAAQKLEVDPASINLMSQQYQNALIKKNTDGSSYIQTMPQFTSTIMSDSSFGYDHTAGARSQASQLVNQLGQMMGVSA